MKDNRKVVIITGCSSGIGKSTVEKYIKEGFYVIGLDKSPCHKMNNFNYYQVNLSDEEEVKNVFQTIKSEGILLDYLINCAGVFYCTDRYEIAKMNSQEWNDVLSNNLNSCMYVVKYAIPLFDINDDSAIVFVSSDQANMPRKRNGAYATSKGAINTFAKTCAVELVDKGIRVNVVEAASVDTNFILKLAGSREKMRQIYTKENEKMPLGLINPDEVAEAIYFLGSAMAKKITGQKILIDSGLYL